MKNGPYELIVPPKKYPGMLYRGRYAYEHHVVFWKRNKRMPKPGYEIHHKDMDHRNNDIHNLQEISAQDHRKLHGKLQSKPKIKIIYCSNCGIKKRANAKSYRDKHHAGQRLFFCSQKCQALKQHQLGGRLRPLATLTEAGTEET